MDASLEEKSRGSDQVLRSRDLLQRFTDGDYRRNDTENPSEESEEVELSLGLSLGGKFGVDPKEGKLLRSSSIAGDFLSHLSRFSSPAISRTCSLPSVSEEDWRKRKEMQSMRRLEAKRKLTEKQRNCRSAKDRTVSEEACEDDRQRSNSAADDRTRFGGCREENKQREVPVSTGSCFDGLSSSSRVLSWAYSAHRQGQRSEKNDEKRLESAPVGSSGCSSIGVSEIENELCRGNLRKESTITTETRQMPDVSNCETRGPATIHSLLETKPSKSPTPSSIVKCDSQSSESGESMNVMEQMPCVSTKGEGPNGRRIEGFLYKYRKGEELRIVCVCHGSFLTPAEFVRHAGGSDVAQPLKHIVVSPSTSSFF